MVVESPCVVLCNFAAIGFWEAFFTGTLFATFLGIIIFLSATFADFLATGADFFAAFVDVLDLLTGFDWVFAAAIFFGTAFFGTAFFGTVFFAAVFFSAVFFAAVFFAADLGAVAPARLTLVGFVDLAATIRCKG